MLSMSKSMSMLVLPKIKNRERIHLTKDNIRSICFIDRRDVSFIELTPKALNFKASWDILSKEEYLALTFNR